MTSPLLVDPGPYQNANGQAHLAYYDSAEHLSFVWDGKSGMAQVCWGGYGEPPLPHLVPVWEGGSCDPTALLDAFAESCRRWVAEVWPDVRHELEP